MTIVEFGLVYSADQERFRAEVAEWLDANVPADINVRPVSDQESYDLYLRRRDLGRKLGAKGWLYPSAPTEYGGGGLGFDNVIVLEEETNKRGIGLPPYYDSGGMMGAPSILVWGTKEQKELFLPPIYRGEVRTWQLLTEPMAGSDLAGVRTTAVRDGGEYVLNGTKIFTGSNHGCERMWVIAVTDPGGERHHNLSWFMIDANLPGITVQPQYLLSVHGEGSADAGHKNTVYFENVRVPAVGRVGEENAGWQVATTHLEIEHGASGSVRQDPIWGQLLESCRRTSRNGKRLIDDPATRIRLAGIYSQLESVRLLAVRNFWMSYAGVKQSYEGSQVSYYRRTVGLWLTKEIHDILGPAALTDDPKWGAMGGFAESHQRSAIVAMHPGGTADIQRVIMARRLRTIEERYRHGSFAIGIRAHTQGVGSHIHAARSRPRDPHRPQ